jgi:hypothetical protein
MPMMTFAGGLHLAKDANDDVRGGVHGDACGVNAGEIDFDPGFGGSGFEGVERVAGGAFGADDAAFLRFGDDIHGAALFLVPVLIEHAVEQQDVDVVGVEFAAEAVEVSPHFGGGGGVGFRENRDLFARERF